MTQIDFYTHATDKLETACRLAAKAMAADFRVLILTEDAATSEALDRLLWSYPATSFVPHCHAAADALAAQTPVIIDHRAEVPTHDDVLVNLRADCPPIFSRFQRLVEIVGLAEDDCRAARERFRFYRDRGYEIRSHSLQQQPAV